MVTPSNPTDAQGISDGETRDPLTHEELRQWLASRKDAGRLIDVETCEIVRMPACDDDPYGIRRRLGEDPYDQWGKNFFVCSPDTNDWIWEGDLPSEKRQALYARLKREANTYENYLQWAKDSWETFHAKQDFWRILGNYTSFIQWRAEKGDRAEAENKLKDLRDRLREQRQVHPDIFDHRNRDPAISSVVKLIEVIVDHVFAGNE
jgi:hypothetical protein